MRCFTKRTLSVLLILVLLFSSMNTMAFAGKPVKVLNISEGDTISIQADPTGIGVFDLSATDGDVSELVWTPTDKIVSVSMNKKKTESTATIRYNVETEPSFTITVVNAGKTDSILVTIEPHTGGTNTPPQNTSLSLNGDFEDGKTITAIHKWDDLEGDILSYTYRWESVNAREKGKKTPLQGTTESYKIKPSDVGRKIRVIVSADDGEFIVEAVSVWSVIIEETVPPVNQAPVNTLDPEISGIYQVGNEITASPGTWTDDGAFNVTYHWESIDVSETESPLTLVGTSTTYSIQADDVDRKIRFVETATDVDFSVVATSAWSDVISDVDPPQTNTIYVALGDSIATGTTGLGSNTPYVEMFHEYLGVETTTLYDFSDDADRTIELLNLLNNSDVKAAIEQADVITISIGGNNLMQAAIENNTLTNRIDPNGDHDGYDFQNINWDVAEAGRQEFEDEWPLIMAKIRSYNQEAEIIMMTIYNPFNIDEGSHSLVDGYQNNGEDGINDIIENNAVTYDYEIAHVKSSFDVYVHDNKSSAVTHFYDTILWFTIYDPHPNSDGQTEIFNLHKALYPIQ